jgi:ankyrin repeat protein
MKKLYLFCCVLSLICPLTNIGQKKVKGCTIGVASGKATADGRPLLWKNRNGRGWNYEVVYFKDGRFKYLAMVPMGDSQGIGGGVNEFGFCTVYSAAFNLPENSEKGVNGGNMMKWALKECVTVDDFENILKQTNVSGRTSTCNIGVIDAFGGAAIFETGNYSYTRFDATNPKVAPQGYIIRANFALTGGGDFGRARYNRANQLWQEVVEKGQLDYRYVLRKVCRDYSGAEEVSHTLPEMEATQSNTIKVLKFQNAISSHSVTYVALFHGVRQDENPSLTTFWTMMGEPVFSVAVPSWVIAESTAPELDGEEFSLLSTSAKDLQMANYVMDDKGKFLLNPEMLPDIWALTYPAEDRIFDQTESTMTQWRQDYPAAQQVASFHRSMASEAMEALQKVTGMLMRKGRPTANLHIALYMRDLEKAKAYIKQGFNINVLDGHGYAPLHHAVQNSQKEIVQLLLTSGADVNTKDNLRRTPLDIAMEKEGDQDIVKLLVGNGAEVSMHVAAFIGDADKIKDFIEHGGSLDTTDVRDWTLLHWATAGNHKDIAKLLIEKGADVNAKDNWDWTPLHCAIYSSKDITEIKSMTELLIATGADTNAKDGGGSTPLSYAQKEGYAEIVQRLCKHGAK